MYQKVQKIAVDFALAAIHSASVEDAYFRTAIRVNVDGSVKSLFLFGNAHPAFEDGHVIAVLNPDEELLAEIIFRNAYSLLGSTEVVRGKCDLMLHLWLDAYKNGKDMVGCINSYKARKSSPAKFDIESSGDSGHASFVDYQSKRPALGVLQLNQDFVGCLPRIQV